MILPSFHFPAFNEQITQKSAVLPQAKSAGLGCYKDFISLF